MRPLFADDLPGIETVVTEHPLNTELFTVRDYVRFAVTRFGEAGLAYGHGTTNALDDAAFLVLETLNLPPDSLGTWLDARLTRVERNTVLSVIESRVVSRKPSSYLTRSSYIGPYNFYVDERVIVPRSFLGELMLNGDDPTFGLDRPPARILDLCTGSGCLAIVAALLFRHAAVVAADVSSDALAVARINIQRHGLQERVEAVETDLFAGLKGQVFDLIISNPPYVADSAIAAFPPEHKAEPALAHRGGLDGLDIVRRILDEAGAHLAPDGLLVMEVGQGRDALEAAYPALPFLWLDTEHSEGEVFTLPASLLQSKARRGRTRASGRTSRE